jgi:sulfite reductase (NADPH) hemoprotein beta-component
MRARIRDFLPESRPAALSRGDPARLQPARPARQQVQGAHQDPRARDGVDTHPHRALSSRRISPAPRAFCRRGSRIGRIRRLLRPARLRTADDAALTAARRRSGCFRLGPTPTSPHKAPTATPSSRVSLKPIGATPGDATPAQMAHPGRLLPNATDMTNCASATSRTSSCRMCARRTCRHPCEGLRAAGLADGQRRPRLRHHRLPRHGLLRARHRAVDPGRATRSRTFRRAEAPARHRPAQDQDLRLHQRLRPSPCRPYRHSRRRPKKGEENYQITLGGSGDENSSIGEIIGRGFSYDDVVDAVETLVDTYIGLRETPQEDFLAAYRRVGDAPFKEALYGTA